MGNLILCPKEPNANIWSHSANEEVVHIDICRYVRYIRHALAKPRVYTRERIMLDEGC
jgi:hypothetical protein